MKSIITTLAALLATIVLFSTVETRFDPTVTPRDFGADSWRHTAEGWEKANCWHTVDSQFDLRSVHPFWVASFNASASVSVLLAFEAFVTMPRQAPTCEDDNRSYQKRAA